MIVFDIETGPLAEEVVLSRAKRFKPPEPPEPFDESKVKLGNLSDPDKITKKINDAKKKCEQALEAYESDVETLREEWRRNAIERAGLDPLTGQVLAIGYASKKGIAPSYVKEGFSEADLIRQFWQQYQDCRRKRRNLIGHNILGFDLPFLVKRSWLLEVEVPETVMELDRCYFDGRVFRDTMKIWGCGQRDMVKLDSLSKSLGGDGKTEGIHGGMFAELFNGTPEDRKKAIDYLKTDLRETMRVAEAMGLMEGFDCG